MEQKFKDSVHNEDSFEIKPENVYVNMTMESGVTQRLFFTHYAIVQIYYAVLEKQLKMQKLAIQKRKK